MGGLNLEFLWLYIAVDDVVWGRGDSEAPIEHEAFKTVVTARLFSEYAGHEGKDVSSRQLLTFSRKSARPRYSTVILAYVVQYVRRGAWTSAKALQEWSSIDEQ